MLHFREKPQTELLNLLHCASATWVGPYKGAPRIDIRPSGLQLFLCNWSCAVISLFAPLLTRVALFQSIRIVLFGPIKLWGFKVLICIIMDQSGTKAGSLFYISQLHLPLNHAHFQFPLKSASKLKLQHQSWTASPKLTHTWTVSQLSCFH